MTVGGIIATALADAGAAVSAGKGATTPSWLTPVVIVSALGVVVNFGFNFLNYRHSRNAISEQFAANQFQATVGAPIEAALGKIEGFAGTVRAIRYHTNREPDSANARRQRAQQCRDAQHTEFGPAKEELEVALVKAARHNPHVAWGELIDETDAILDALNVLCRDDSGAADVNAAFDDIGAAVATVCADIRDRVRRESAQLLRIKL